MQEGWEDRTTHEIRLRYHTYLAPEGIPVQNNIFYALGGNSSYMTGGPASPDHELYEDIMKPYSMLAEQAAYRTNAPVGETVEENIERESSESGNAFSDHEEPTFLPDDERNDTESEDGGLEEDEDYLTEEDN